MIYDVLIIGAGASGLAAAVRLKQSRNELSVAVLEQLPRVGKKLITTGNGRCNITNKHIDISRYHGEEVSFAKYALEQYPNTAAEQFFSRLGVVFTFDELGRGYPYSLQAASVVDALRFSAEELGVEILCDTAALDYRKSGDKYTVFCDGASFKAKNLIIAAGLYSGGDKLGSSGGLLRLMKQKGYKTVKTTPAIVQLKCDPQLVRSLKGIKVNANVILRDKTKVLRAEFGEVLFCDYGLSGPPILQLSRSVERTGSALTAELDLMPEYSEGEISEMLKERVKNLRNRGLDEFFTGMLNKRVGQYIIKKAGLALSDSATALKGREHQLAKIIKSLCFPITGTTGFINSQVTAGGLSTCEFDCKTMMSKKENGVFAIGEILDIDGDCGGFNLQWAWSSAFAAADFIGAMK